MTIKERLTDISTNRLKLVVMHGAEATLLASFNRINHDGIPVVNIGKSLAGSLQLKGESLRKKRVGNEEPIT